MTLTVEYRKETRKYYGSKKTLVAKLEQEMQKLDYRDYRFKETLRDCRK